MAGQARSCLVSEVCLACSVYGRESFYCLSRNVIEHTSNREDCHERQEEQGYDENRAIIIVVIVVIIAVMNMAR